MMRNKPISADQISGRAIWMGHPDRDQDGLEDSMDQTDESDSDRVEEVNGNDSSNERESGKL